ncbi:Transcriptional regulator, GntR family [Rubellimicrobium mesophilum DSM 19309]|uniref:Transcriptional regulator, GntR family n=1 Tax=Rubellimicrobium mesophilum DSM 19309 TaxID=442562 RepID=A0A017HSP9_9RHOB|nr:GntR family transcriptional regulator [Rubellimicrobium mesophilum]EYD77173.1 Transcriptional regulator, GntR family [Rubellimicrobium mesophilum DSM 19309]
MSQDTVQMVAEAPAFRPLSDFAGTLSQRVYASLKEAILDLSLRPGAILRKGDVCEALGVSRSPVSEAVARLASEALVDIVPQAGTFVARLSLDEVREGAFLREALELAAVEEVARAITEEQLVELRRNLRLQEGLVADGDIRGFYAADAGFHELLLSFTGHRRLPGLSRTAWVHVDRARRLLLPEPGRVEETLAEHRAILAALEARDPEAARAATRAHLRQVVTRLERLGTERPELFA